MNYDNCKIEFAERASAKTRWWNEQVQKQVGGTSKCKKRVKGTRKCKEWNGTKYAKYCAWFYYR